MSALKSTHEVTAEIRRRLTNHWHTDLAGTSCAFPHTFFLGRPSRAALEADWPHHHQIAVDLQDWATDHGIHLDTKDRAVYRTTQRLPEYATADTLDIAARVSGPDWTQRLIRNRHRLAILTDRFPHAEAANALRVTDKYKDREFDTLLAAADWFNANPGAAEGLTPRMVPIPGVHAKWLQGHSKGVTALTGVTITDLVRHPQRIHFTYLDPDHRDSGGRWHESATVGDAFTPAYQPTVVVISENKDTAIHFPPVPGGIAVEGDGFGGKTAAAFPWLTGAPTLLYWGDLDAHGYEILDGYRADGLPVVSILMDPATYDAYEPHGTNQDKNGNPLKSGTPKPLPHLTDAERAVYAALLREDHPGHRRIEQERIPLEAAARALILCTAKIHAAGPHGPTA